MKRAERHRDVAERARLLYVAATRARERLHVVGQLAPAKPTPATHTLLGHLWTEVAPDSRGVAPTAVAAPPAPEELRPALRRLTESTVLTLSPPLGAIGAAHRPRAAGIRVVEPNRGAHRHGRASPSAANRGRRRCSLDERP